MNERLLASADKGEIRELSYRYMRGLDRHLPDLLAEVFHEDAQVDYGFFKGAARDFVGFAMNALADHDANHHMLGQILVDLEGDVAFGEVYYNAYHRITGGDGEKRDLFIAGRYVDRYERRGGVWKMAFRSELVDWVREDPASDAWLAATPGVLRGARGGDDPSSQRERLRGR